MASERKPDVVKTQAKGTVAKKRDWAGLEHILNRIETVLTTDPEPQQVQRYMLKFGFFGRRYAQITATG